VLASLIVGVALLIWTLPSAVCDLRLLRFGTETRGKRIGNAETLMQVNHIPVMRLSIEYEVSGNLYVATAILPRPGPLEDNEGDTILHDPMMPARATTLADLIGPKVSAFSDALTSYTGFEIRPAVATMSPDGELEVQPGIAFNLLVVPPILFVGLGVAAVIRMI
jgi:hypothetical protein